jgi:hypothetical protein
MKLINEIKKNSGLELNESFSDIAMRASKRFWKESPYDYDPDRDVKFLAKIIDDTIAYGKQSEKSNPSVATMASKIFWKKGTRDYDPVRDVKFLAGIISQELGSKPTEQTKKVENDPISEKAMRASKRFWKESPYGYDPDRDVKFLAKIIDQEFSK